MDIRMHQQSPPEKMERLTICCRDDCIPCSAERGLAILWMTVLCSYRLYHHDVSHYYCRHRTATNHSCVCTIRLIDEE